MNTAQNSSVIDYEDYGNNDEIFEQQDSSFKVSHNLVSLPWFKFSLELLYLL